MKKRIALAERDDDLDGIEAVERLAGWARKIIGAISGVLGLFFAWIQLKEVPLNEVLESASPQFLTTTALIIYYACWIGGTNFDVRIQQRVYVAEPKRGRIAVDTIMVTVIFFVVTAALIAASKNVNYFAILLAFFVTANIFGWWHIIDRVKPAITKSRAKFREQKRYFRLEQLNLVDTYMTGKWQMHRFWSMLGMVAAINIICFVDTAREAIATLSNWLGLDVPRSTIANLLPGITILGFVLVAESWIWVKRINVHTALFEIDELRKRYVLTPSQTKP